MHYQEPPTITLDLRRDEPVKSAPQRVNRRLIRTQESESDRYVNTHDTRTGLKQSNGDCNKYQYLMTVRRLAVQI